MSNIHTQIWKLRELVDNAIEHGHGSGDHQILQGYLYNTYGIKTRSTNAAIQKGAEKLAQLESYNDIPDNLDELIEASKKNSRSKNK